MATKSLAANQGLYNGFLAAGLIWGLLHPLPGAAWHAGLAPTGSAAVPWSTPHKFVHQFAPELLAVASTAASRHCQPKRRMYTRFISVVSVQYPSRIATNQP